MEDIDKFWDGTTTISGGEGERELTKEEKRERAKQVCIHVCMSLCSCIGGRIFLALLYVFECLHCVGLYIAADLFVG